VYQGINDNRKILTDFVRLSVGRDESNRDQLTRVVACVITGLNVAFLPKFLGSVHGNNES
jgi:hypothetical protein